MHLYSILRHKFSRKPTLLYKYQNSLNYIPYFWLPERNKFVVVPCWPCKMTVHLCISVLTTVLIGTFSPALCTTWSQRHFVAFSFYPAQWFLVAFRSAGDSFFIVTWWTRLLTPHVRGHLLSCIPPCSAILCVFTI